MRRLASALALSVLLTQPARAADDFAVAHDIIASQMEAIGRDDAAVAYGYAAPEIQTLFPQADAFMAMVRKSYAPLYRHQKFEFGEAKPADGKFFQTVHIIDTDGVPWNALYTLDRQPDGSVKISGCVLFKVGQGV